MEQRTILVVGGTGRTGRHVVDKLVGVGHPVRVLARNPERAGFGEGVEVVRSDVGDREEVRAAAESVAGIVTSLESGVSDGATNGPERVHHQGTLNVIEAVLASGQAHVVMVSQIYITRPDAYPEVRATILARGRAEEALRESGLPYTIVRPSWLMGGPGGREGIRFEQGDTGDGRVAREDVAEVCVRALENGDARGKTFELYNEPGAPLPDWGTAFASLRPDRQASPPAGGR